VSLSVLLLSLVYAAAPHGSSYAPESGEEQEARYVEIVKDAMAVAREQPLPGYSKRQTAVIILAVAHRESAFARDADLGPCTRTADGRCDYGRAVCLMQVQAATRERKAELAADRRECFRAGVSLIRQGFKVCPREPYAVFAGGSCEHPKAVASGREIQVFVRRWLARVEGSS
jgi:hypothetical protein